MIQENFGSGSRYGTPEAKATPATTPHPPSSSPRPPKAPSPKVLANSQALNLFVPTGPTGSTQEEVRTFKLPRELPPVPVFSERPREDDQNPGAGTGTGSDVRVCLKPARSGGSSVSRSLSMPVRDMRMRDVSPASSSASSNSGQSGPGPLVSYLLVEKL